MSSILIPVSDSRDAIMAAAFANRADQFTVLVYGSRAECEDWRTRHSELLASREARWYPAQRMYRFRNNSAVIAMVSSEQRMDGWDADIFIQLGKQMVEHHPLQQVRVRGGLVINERHGMPPREECA